MMRCSNFAGQTFWRNSFVCAVLNPMTADAGHPRPRRRHAHISTATIAGAISPCLPKTFGRHGRHGRLGTLAKISPFLLAAASAAACPRRPTLTSPPQVVSLCHTSGARPANSPLGVAGSFDFVVAVQRQAFPTRKRASPADSCLRPRLIFLPLVAIACTTRTLSLRV
jgi:hypothetical protein